jgi:phosphoglycolate phosphatase-like HAD superfamily hydrolase
MKRVVAFDLDETMMTPVISEAGAIVGVNVRAGLVELLDRLSEDFILYVWSSGERHYVLRMLELAGLSQVFERVIAWDDYRSDFKDIRRFGVDFLVDDNDDLLHIAQEHHGTAGYVIVPAMYSAENDEVNWCDLVFMSLGVLT